MPSVPKPFELKPSSPKSEYDRDFLQGMLDRMSVSYHKYGPVAEGYPDRVDALESLQLRIERYLETKNTEFLIDAANFCMIKFMHPRLPGAHFEPTDSSGSPGQNTASGNVNKQDKNNRLIPNLREGSRCGLVAHALPGLQDPAHDVGRRPVPLFEGVASTRAA